MRPSKILERSWITGLAGVIRPCLWSMVMEM